MDEQNFPNIFEEPEHDPQHELPPQKRLERSRTDVIISGTCSGIAKYMNIDTGIVRLFALLGLLFGIWIIAAYFVTAFLIPAEYEFVEPTDEEKEFQRKVNFRIVIGGLLMLTGLHLGLVSLGLFSSERLFVMPDSFLFPFIAIIVGSYFLGMKEYKTADHPGLYPERFIRSRNDRKLLGVCGGFARYLNVESTTVRIIFAIATLLTLGFFAVVYLLFALTIKMEEQEVASQQ